MPIRVEIGQYVSLPQIFVIGRNRRKHFFGGRLSRRNRAAILAMPLSQPRIARDPPEQSQENDQANGRKDQHQHDGAALRKKIRNVPSGSILHNNERLVIRV